MDGHVLMPHPFTTPPPRIPSSKSRHASFGGFGSNQEPTTPMSIQGSFQHILRHLEDDDGGEKNAPRNKVKVMWSTEEEKCLARACSITTNDPNVGNAQNNKHFWQSTTVYYNENLPAGTRAGEWTAVKSHYYRIMLDVGKFSGWYNNSFSNRTSGQSDADVLVATHDMWKNAHENITFKCEHV